MDKCKMCMWYANHILEVPEVYKDKVFFEQGKGFCLRPEVFMPVEPDCKICKRFVEFYERWR